MKFTTSFCAAFLFSFTLLFFGPSYLYWSNVSSFTYFYTLLLPYLIASSVAVGALGAIVLFLFRGALHQKAVACITAAGVLLWVQGYLLVWDYGALDGSDIMWADYVYRGILDSALWVFLIAICIFKSSFVYKNVRTICVIFIVIQAVSLGITFKNAPPPLSALSYRVCDEHKFDFSGDKNIIVIVLDAFRGDVFQDIIDNDSSYADILKGFTFFRDSISGYPATHLSIPFLLTGRYYDNSMPFDVWTQEVYTRYSIPKRLKDAGYRVELYPWTPVGHYYSEHIADNFVVDGSDTIAADEIGYIVDLALFRLAPNFLKQPIYNQQKWFLKRIFFSLIHTTLPSHPEIFSRTAFQQSSDVRFIDSMLEKANINSTEPAFKFFHLTAPHSPVLLNEHLEYERMDFTADNYNKYAKASLRMMELLLNRLKDLNVYDNSMIFIVSDHGVPDFNAEFGRGMGFMDSRDVQSALPVARNLFLAKPFEAARVPLAISDAPVALCDVSQTIFSAVMGEDETTHHAINVFAANSDMYRERRFLYYNYLEFTPPFFGNMIEYHVTGSVWDENSWQETYTMFTKDGIFDYSPSLNLGGKLEITFGRKGNSTPYQTYGFDEHSEDVTWTMARAPFLRFCTLMIPYRQPLQPIMLKLQALPFLLENKILQQSVILGVNDIQVPVRWIFSENSVQEKVKIIDHELLKDKFLMLSMWFPDARSAKDLGIGEDTSMRALALKKLTIEEASGFYTYGEEILFGLPDVPFQQDAVTYQQLGWAPPERHFTCIDGKEATLILPVDEIDDDVLLKFQAFAVTAAGSPDSQRLQLYVNGNMVGEWEISEETTSTELVIPSLMFENFLRLTFELPDAVYQSESDIKRGIQSSTVGLKSLVIVRKQNWE